MTLNVSWQQIEGTLCSAWEGGSNYWLECYDFRPPADPADVERIEHRYQNALYSGGACLVRLVEERTELAPLTREKLLEGLQIFAQKYPKHFSNMLSDKSDAETGDVYLQCCLFGEVVYG